MSTQGNFSINFTNRWLSKDDMIKQADINSDGKVTKGELYQKFQVTDDNEYISVGSLNNYFSNINDTWNKKTGIGVSINGDPTGKGVKALDLYNLLDTNADGEISFKQGAGGDMEEAGNWKNWFDQTNNSTLTSFITNLNAKVTTVPPSTTTSNTGLSGLLGDKNGLLMILLLSSMMGGGAAGGYARQQQGMGAMLPLLLLLLKSQQSS